MTFPTLPKVDKSNTFLNVFSGVFPHSILSAKKCSTIKRKFQDDKESNVELKDLEMYKAIKLMYAEDVFTSSGGEQTDQSQHKLTVNIRQQRQPAFV